MTMRISFWWLLATASLPRGRPFVVRNTAQFSFNVKRKTSLPPLFQTADDAGASPSTLQDAASMRVKEIKSELTERGISFTDCFDKESLVQRLNEARDGTVQPTQKPSVVETKNAEPAADVRSEAAKATESQASNVGSSSDNDSDEKQSTSDPPVSASEPVITRDFASMRVKELRQECASRGIRWGTFVEKDDFVKALVEDEALSAGFSASGMLRPGFVADISGDVLRKELEASDMSSLLVLDVYATWCGPCQLMAPQLEQAAADWKRNVRVVKMDSDKNPEWSSKLRVQGLPTVLVFKGGKEVERVEGALMKDGLIDLASKHMD